MQWCSHTRENRTASCFGLAAHGDHVGEYVLRGLPNIEDGLRLVARDVDSIPRSCNASNAKGFRTPGSNPALWASKKSLHISLSNAAAIWLRALFCTHMKRTFFFTGPNV